MRIKAPKDALQAHLESEDLGIWAGKGRVVAESAAATIIYLDQRFRIPLVKIGNSKILRATFPDAGVTAGLDGQDRATIAGKNYQFRIRAREDETHLIDIRGRESSYQQLDPAGYPVFVDHLKRAAALVKAAHEPKEKVIYLGGSRLRNRMLAVSPFGHAIYLAELPVKFPSMRIPIVNVPLFDLFDTPTTWLSSDENSIVIDRNSGIFLQASFLDQAVPVQLTTRIRELREQERPIIAEVSMQEFSQAIRLLLITETEHFTFQAANGEIRLYGQSSELFVPAISLHEPIEPISFSANSLQLLQDSLDQQGDILQITKTELGVDNLIFKQPSRTLILAALRRST